MSENVVIVNTHPDENPEFVGKLVDFMNSLGIEPEIIEGHENANPLDRCPSQIILTGVPISADYSLAEADTQREGIPYIMYHPEREMYGVQFVPEQSDERSKELLKRFVGR